MGPGPWPPGSDGLGDPPPHHEGTNRTPESTQQRVAQQDQRPPPGPEQGQHRIGCAVLGTKPEHQIHRDEQPADQSKKQSVPELWSPHPPPQLWFPAPDIEASPCFFLLCPKHLLRQHVGRLIRGLVAGLAQGPIHQTFEFAQVVGEIMVLQPPHYRFRQSGRLHPAQARALQAQLVTQPVAQIRSAYP